MSLPNIYKPTKQYELIRIGKDNDGGYLCGTKNIKSANTLISFGISEDWSFEKDFLKINHKVQLYCYDDVLSKTLWLQRFWKDLGKLFYNFKIKPLLNSTRKYLDFLKFFSKNKLIKKRIGYNDVDTIFQNKNISRPVFFKIDIEGSEYRILDDLIKFQEDICGVIIEFHDIDLHKEKICKFIERLDLTLTHIHQNNMSPVDPNNDPIGIELTFEKNPVIVQNNLTLPNKLDQINDPLLEDIILNFK